VSDTPCMTDPAAAGPIPLRVLVVDPDDRIRESITMLLPIGGRCAVVGGAAGTLEAMALAATLMPDVAVIDSRLPDDECAEGFLATLRSTVPGIRILVLNWDAVAEPVASLSGADAYIRKTFRPHELIDAVISAARLPAA
jgi:DNA-binding NarL/FixJ family response regulator